MSVERKRPMGAPEPTTAAGRALLHTVDMIGEANNYDVGLKSITKAIFAIEAEAFLAGSKAEASERNWREAAPDAGLREALVWALDDDTPATKPWDMTMREWDAIIARYREQEAKARAALAAPAAPATLDVERLARAYWIAHDNGPYEPGFSIRQHFNDEDWATFERQAAAYKSEEGA